VAGEAVMRAPLFVTAAIVAGIVAAASAQSGTADGVAALARGDYQRAVEILKPLAEDWQSQDAASQFFMASMYESGHGVPADPLRACALYARAASKNQDPFSHQANTLFVASMARGQEFNEECQLLATVGFDTGFEPVTFDLGPGHFVEWTLRGATVTYEGRTKRQSMLLAEPGARFLPLQHTELATGPTRSVTRHFVEVSLWSPVRKSGHWTGQWDLQWHVFEIVRDEIVPIDTPQPLLTIDGDAPPRADAFDVHNYAVVRVDDGGNSEWAVLKGPHTQKRAIETDAERRETRDVALARDAALKRVDWNRRSDVKRLPAMTVVDSDGCGYFQLVGWTADRDEASVVRVNVRELGLAAQSATFDLSRDSVNISVESYVYDAPQRRSNFCTDVRFRAEVEPEVWRAIAGTISIELSAPGTRSGPRATVTLTNLVLRNSAGTTVKVTGPVRLSAIVGAVFG
jgi:hypothetical protein